VSNDGRDLAVLASTGKANLTAASLGGAERGLARKVVSSWSVIARSEATRQSIPRRGSRWIASLCSRWRKRFKRRGSWS